MNFPKENRLTYHLNKATMYMMFADKYKYTDPVLHEKYYKKYIKHVSRLEAYYESGKEYNGIPLYMDTHALQASTVDREMNMTDMMPLHNVGVRLLHASSDVPAVDVYANGVRIAQNIAYGQATEYLPIPSRTYKVELFPAGKNPTGRPLLSQTLDVDARKFYTVAIVGKQAAFTLLPIADMPVPVYGKAKVRFVHLSPDAPAVDIAVTGGPILFRNVSFKQATGYIEVPAGTVDVEVRLAGTAQIVLTVPNVTLRTNVVYSSFAIGLAQGHPPLKALLLLDNSM